MDPVTIGTIVVTAVTGITSWFRATQAQRQATAAAGARAQLAWVCALVVKQIEKTVRKDFSPTLTATEARDLLTLAVKRALALLAPQRKAIEKALGVDLNEVIRAELEIALQSQRQVIRR